MSSQPLSISTRGIGWSAAGRAGVLVYTRRVLQGLGGAGLVAFAAAMPWAEFTTTGITLGPVGLPAVVLAFSGLIVLAGLAFFAGSVWGLVRRLPARTLVGVTLVAAATGLSVAGFEYGYLRTGGVSAYEYRPAVRLVLYTLGIGLLACSVPEDLGPRVAGLIRRRAIGWRAVLAFAGGVVCVGGLIGWGLLDGMPHITDGTAYLLEARTLYAGRLALDTPMHPALFDRELLAFRITDAGYFGKYPIGWPLVLGLFDAAGAAWLANAALAGCLVLVTYGVVAERGGRRLAGLAAGVAALCPWLWFNAATMMSHLASAVWLWLFLWLYLRATRTRQRSAALSSGLALGAAVLTRPADAAFFALPCVGLSLVLVCRDPRLWLTRLPLVAVGALPSVAAYLFVGRYLTGGGSTYGGGHASAVFMQTPQSLAHALAWLQESWVGLSSQWLAGAAPAGAMILCGLVFGRRLLRGQWLGLCCGTSLFLCYGVFVFGGRAWVGPRWYVPLIPVGALLIAAGIQAAAKAARARSAGGILAAGYLRAAAVALAVTLVVAVPARLIELAQSPPHGIDGRVVQTVKKAGLKQAVVALPANGLDEATGQPNYKRGIAGMWSMQTPFEHSEVIYVAGVEGWQDMAHAAWPGRALYAMNNATGDYTLTPVATASPDAEPQP